MSTSPARIVSFDTHPGKAHLTFDEIQIWLRTRLNPRFAVDANQAQKLIAGGTQGLGRTVDVLALVGGFPAIVKQAAPGARDQPSRDAAQDCNGRVYVELADYIHALNSWDQAKLDAASGKPDEVLECSYVAGCAWEEVRVYLDGLTLTDKQAIANNFNTKLFAFFKAALAVNLREKAATVTLHLVKATSMAREDADQYGFGKAGSKGMPAADFDPVILTAPQHEDDLVMQQKVLQALWERVVQVGPPVPGPPRKVQKV